MTTRFNRIPKVFLALSVLTFGAGGVALASPGHSTTPAAYAKPAALVANAANGPGKMKAKRTKKKTKSAVKQHKRAQRIARFDSNHDGKIDQGERNVVRDRRFAALDTNADGTLTLAEMREAKAKRTAANKGMKAQRKAANKGMKAQRKANKGMKAKRQARQGMQRKNTAKRFTKLDSDQNGSVSRREFVQRQGKGQRQGRAKRL